MQDAFSREMRKTRRTFLKVASATAIGLAGCTGGEGGEDTSTETAGGGTEVGSTRDDEVPTFDIGYLPGAVLNGSLTKSFTIEDIKENVLPHPPGEAYEIEGIEVQGTNEIVSSVAAGEADGGVVPPGALSPALEEGLLSIDDISIVWPESIYGPDAGHSDNYAAAAGSGITGWDDIPGTTFAVNTFGSGSDVSARLGMQNHGIDPESDVDMVQIPFPDQVEALESGRVDIGTFLQPFYEQAREEVGGLNYLFDFATPFGNTMAFFMILTNEVIEESPDAARAMAENAWATANFSRNEEEYDPDTVAAEIADATGISEEIAYRLQFGTTDEDYPSPAGRAIGYAAPYRGWRMEPEFVNPAVQGLVDSGQLEEMIDYSPMITNEFIPEAADQPPEPLR